MRLRLIAPTHLCTDTASYRPHTLVLCHTLTPVPFNAVSMLMLLTSGPFRTYTLGKHTQARARTHTHTHTHTHTCTHAHARTGVRGGTELGMMSATRKFEVALQYTGYTRKKMPTVFKIGINAVSRGAVLQEFSQYPGTWCSIYTFTHTHTHTHTGVSQYPGTLVCLSITSCPSKR